MWIYIYIYTYTYVYMYIYIFIHLNIDIYTYIYIYTCIYTYIHTYMCIHMQTDKYRIAPVYVYIYLNANLMRCYCESQLEEGPIKQTMCTIFREYQSELMCTTYKLKKKITYVPAWMTVWCVDPKRRNTMSATLCALPRPVAGESCHIGMSHVT